VNEEADVNLEPLVRAHAFLRIERPPEIWEADTDDTRFVPLLGEMIAAGLAGGAPLRELTLNVANIESAGPEHEDGGDLHAPAGRFVGVTISGRIDIGPDHVWQPSRPPAAECLLGRLHPRLVDAGARFAYVRRLPGAGSVTVFLAATVAGAGTGVPDALDAMTAAPRHHHLLFENESVRVLDTRVGSGERTPVHTHALPSVLYVIGWSDFVRYDAHGRVLVDSRAWSSRPAAGGSIWSEPLDAHAVENVGLSDLRVISVELKSRGGDGA
jgi:hypothetical protein